MNQLLFNQSKNILYIAISLAVGTLIGIKLYKTFEDAKIKKELILKRQDMDLFYILEFSSFYGNNFLNPEIFIKSCTNDMKEIELKMRFDGYSNVEINDIKFYGYKDAVMACKDTIEKRANNAS